MALYKITRKEIETTEYIYEVDATSESEALENYATGEWGKIFPQQTKTTKHTELIIENIL
jgi:hypothetical protein